MLKVSIVGLGYWGPNLLRNFNANSQCEVVYAVDMKKELINKFQPQYPNVKFVEDYSVVLEDDNIDAVVIATPVWTHYDLAKKALLKNKNVLVEKPMTSTSEESKELVEIAKERGLSLMVDHTFLYTGAVQKIKDLIDNKEIGEITYFDSTRINLGLFQADCNVLWDLAPHDLSILFHLVGDKPVSVQATGLKHENTGFEHVAYLTINFESNKIAHFNCSWSSPVKIRSILIGGDKKMLHYNDMEPTEKIKVYDHGYQVRTNEERNKIIADYRIGDIVVPKVAMKEALAGVAEDFLNSISNKTKPVSDMDLGFDVVRVLEAADESLKNGGIAIEI